MPQGPRNWPPQGSNDDSDHWDVSSESYAELKKKLRDNISILEGEAKRGSALKEAELLAAEEKLREVETHEQAALRQGDRLNAIVDRSMDRKDRAESGVAAKRENEFLAYKESMAKAATEDPSRRRKIEKEIEEVRAQIAAMSEASKTSRISVEEEKRLETRLDKLERELMAGRPDQYSSSSVLHYFGDNIKVLDRALESNPELRKQKLTIAKNYMTRAVDLAARMSKVETADEFHRIKREMDEIRDGFNRLIPPPVMEEIKNPEKRRYTPTQNIILGESAPAQNPAQPETPAPAAEPSAPTAPQEPEQAPPQPAPAPEPVPERPPAASPTPLTGEKYVAPAYTLAPNQRPDAYYGTPNVSVSWNETFASQGEAPSQATDGPTPEAAPAPAAVDTPSAETVPAVVPPDINALIAAGDMKALEQEADRYYDESVARMTFIAPYHHRELQDAHKNVGYLAREIAELPEGRKRNKKIAELREEMTRMNSVGMEWAQLLGQQEETEPVAEASSETEEQEPAAKKSGWGRRILGALGLAGLVGAGYYGVTQLDSESSQPAPTAASGGPEGNTTRGQAASAESRRGAPVAQAEFTSGSLQRGEGADVLFYDLWQSLNRQYGNNTASAPASVQYILSQNPHMLGRALGFSGFVKNGQQNVPGSRVMQVGDRLSVDDHGRLSFFDARTNRTTNLMDTVDNKPRVLTVMNDPLRPDTAPRVSVSFNRQPAVSAEQTRQVIAPQPQQPTAQAVPSAEQAPPSPPPVAVIPPQSPESTNVTPPQQPTEQTNSETTPPEQPIPPPQEVTPPPVEPPAETVQPAPPPQQEANQQAQSETSRTEQQNTWANSIERLEQVPLWSASASENALSLFETPAPEGSPRMMLRQNVFEVMKESGVGPNPNETGQEYLARARAARERGGVVTPYIVETPGPTPYLVAHGGDFMARQVLARIYLRQMLQQNPQTNGAIVVEDDPGSGSRGFVMTTDLFRNGADQATAYVPVETLRLQVPQIAPGMRRVF